MLYVWKRSPFLRLVLPFLIGIFLAESRLLSSEIVFSGCITSYSFTLLYAILFPKIPHSARMVPGICYALLFFFFGLALFNSRELKSVKHHYAHHLTESTTLVVRITDAPQIRERSTRIYAEVKSLHDKDQYSPVSGRILLYLPNDSISHQLKVDDVIAIHCTPRPVEGPANPGEFDYSTYLSHQYIVAQAFVKENEWKLIEKCSSHSFKGKLIQLRETIINTFQTHGIAGNELSVLSALVLGKSDGLDKSVMADYAASGTIHVLAVSGLHVGLIYVLLAPLFRLLLPGQSRRFFRAFVPTVLLWLYAALTGLSPSVLRAALMFSFFIIAETYGRKNNSFNTMSASALLLLAFDPHLLFSLGFQLSYLAVIGIVVLQKPLVNLLCFKNKWGRKIWQLTSVSLAAQIVTLPLTLFYFHRFPNYFLLANLVMIPLSTVLLYTAIGFIGLQWIPYAGPILAKLLSALTSLLNILAAFFGRLPGAVSDDIQLSPLQAVLLCFLLLFAQQFLLWKMRQALIPLLMVCCSMLVILFLDQRDRKQQNEICLFTQRNNAGISWIDGQEAFFVPTDSATASPAWIEGHLLPYWQKNGVQDCHVLSPDTLAENLSHRFLLSPPFILCDDQVILIADSVHLSRASEADVLILGKSLQRHYFSANEVADIACAKNIFCSGLSRKKISFLNKSLHAYGAEIIPSDKGALIYRNGEWRAFRGAGIGFFR